ncbi:co-chaperonin GroES [Acinetobacter phage vB_AbaM_KissB]
MQHLAHGNFILVEDTENESVTDGGIVLAKGAKEQESTKRSKIISISEQLLQRFESMNHKFPLKEGDFIYRRYFSGTMVMTKDDKTYYALHIDDVLSKEI